MEKRTDGPTDWQTDEPSYRDARSRDLRFHDFAVGSGSGSGPYHSRFAGAGSGFDDNRLFRFRFRFGSGAKPIYKKNLFLKEIFLSFEEKFFVPQEKIFSSLENFSL